MKNWTGGVLALFCIIVAPTHAADLERGKAQSVGMSEARLERLDAAMQAYVDDRKLAGIVTLVARRGKIVQFQAYGDADVESDLPMRKDSIFRIYSMTKPVTSVAVMMLHEEGRFLLSDPISKYIPELADPQVWVSGEGDEMVTRPAAREVTIRDVLTHMSGYGYNIIPSAVSDRYVEKGIVPGSRTVPGQARDLQDFVTRLGTEPLISDPGTAWNYSVSTDVLGRLVEVVSGMSFDRFLQQRIFEPLGMKDTAFWVAPENIDRFTVTYGIDEQERLTILDPIAESQYLRQPTLLSGGGGLTSGIALALEAKEPGLRARPVEPEGFDDVARSLVLGGIERNNRMSGSICDAIITPEPGKITFPIMARLCGPGIAVSEDQALAAVAMAFNRLHIVLEPGGAVALAAALYHPGLVSGGAVIAVASGGNVDKEVFVRALDRFGNG